MLKDVVCYEVEASGLMLVTFPLDGNDPLAVGLIQGDGEGERLKSLQDYHACRFEMGRARVSPGCEVC